MRRRKGKTMVNGSKEKAYAAEAKARWGDTEAYREWKTKAAGSTKTEADLLKSRLTELFAAFGALKDGDPASDAAQAKVGELQAFISTNIYCCTDGILMGLGQMYVADERFRANIDGAGGLGTAEFVRDAIAVHCRNT